MIYLAGYCDIALSTYYLSILKKREDDGTDALAYICRGLLNHKRGNLQKAISDFNQAIKLNPENETAYRNRGKVRLQLQDHSGAIADFNQALTINPDDTYG